MKKMTGYEALEAKRQDNGVVLNKYGDPTEGARENIRLEEAEEIAREDAGLLWAVTRQAS